MSASSCIFLLLPPGTLPGAGGDEGGLLLLFRGEAPPGEGLGALADGHRGGCFLYTIMGGPVCRPYDGSGCGHFFFVGAGHWPARRCTRRVQEAVPYSPAPAAACSAKAGAAVETHQRKFLRTQGPVARKEFRLSLRFPRAGNFAELLRRDSRKTGSGVRRIWARQCPS